MTKPEELLLNEYFDGDVEKMNTFLENHDKDNIEVGQIKFLYGLYWVVWAKLNNVPIA